MQRRLRGFVVCLILAGSAKLAVAEDTVQQVLARMDKAANDFKAMTAQVTHIDHTDVLNEDTKEIGTVTMQKVRPGEVEGRVDFTAPDRKTITFQKRKIQEYLPKINTLQVFDLDRHGEQLDRFLMIGFGTSGIELAKDYEVSLLTKDKAALQLRLIPKGAEARQYVQKLDLWIPEQGDPYPLREKIFEPSGNYVLVTYEDLKINPPLKPDAMQLKLPPGVKTEYPGK
jgi:outer membrane lipoprotein-sorting protein